MPSTHRVRSRSPLTVRDTLRGTEHSTLTVRTPTPTPSRPVPRSRSPPSRRGGGKCYAAGTNCTYGTKYCTVCTVLYGRVPYYYRVLRTLYHGVQYREYLHNTIDTEYTEACTHTYHSMPNSIYSVHILHQWASTTTAFKCWPVAGRGRFSCTCMYIHPCTAHAVLPRPRVTCF